MAFFLTLFMITYLRYENARRDALAREAGQVTPVTSDDEELAQKELADDAAWFRYTL